MNRFTILKVNTRRRWYFEVTLIGVSKGTRIGWAISGGDFSRGVISQGKESKHAAPTASVPRLGHGSDSWGICGNKEGKSYHQAGLLRAARIEAVSRLRKDEHKAEEEKGETDAGGQIPREATPDRSSGGEDSDTGDGSGEQGETAGEDREDGTADSIFLALGGLFRDTSIPIVQEHEDGGNPIEYSPIAENSAPPSTQPPPAAGEAESGDMKEQSRGPLIVSERGGIPPPPPLPPPPPPPPLSSRALTTVKMIKSHVPRVVDAPLRSWGAGAVIGCLADLVDTDEVDGDGSGTKGMIKFHFFLNGRPVNGNPSVPIFTTTVDEVTATAATGAIDKPGDDWALCPAYSCAFASDGVSINLGETPFQFPPDGLLATVGPSSEGRGSSSASPAVLTASAAATAVAAAIATGAPAPSPTREKRSRYGGSSTGMERVSHPVFGKTAERALEAAFGLTQEGRSTPVSAHGEGGGNEEAPERGRSPSPPTSSDRGGTQTTGGNRGRTKGIHGGVLTVKDAAVSRCVRFNGCGWAFAPRPNLTIQTLDVFLVEALIRPAARNRADVGGSQDKDSAGEGVSSGADVEDEGEIVVFSQGGQSGFYLAVEGTRAVLWLNGPEAAVKGTKHVTPEGVLPAPGTWFKLSATVARDTSPGVDQVQCCLSMYIVSGTFCLSRKIGKKD